MFRSLKNSLDFSILSLPTFIGKISILFSFLFTLSLSKDGISSLHGAHQTAQKFNNTNFPLNSSKLILLFS